MENLITYTLFGSAALFLAVVCVFVISLFVADKFESGESAAMATVVLLLANYFWGTFPVLEYLTVRNVGIYLFIGFVFSLIRTYFKGRELREDPESKARFALKDHVFRWWFLFPVSFLSWLFSGILKDLFDVVYTKISGVYTKLFHAA